MSCLKVPVPYGHECHYHQVVELVLSSGFEVEVSRASCPKNDMG